MFVGKVWKLLAIYPSIDIEQRDKAKFFEKKTKKQKKNNGYSSYFLKNFEKITNTSLFSLKQLNYSLSISMKRYSQLGLRRC